MHYRSMDVDFTPLKTFATSRPVLYGAPLAAVCGVVLGLVFQVGSQTEVRDYTDMPRRTFAQQEAGPIAWPSGKVPDYVIGSDFLPGPERMAPPAPLEPEPFEMPPVMTYNALPAPVEMAQRPAVPEGRWASRDGDILDVSLPEDREMPEPEPAMDDSEPLP